ncbi:MAG TPA: transposase [Fermentimonas sp.]|nr:transposase [Fermentimonas sp.]
MKKRTFSKEEKLQIIKEATIHGVQVTLDKHGVYPASYYSWKKKFEEMGEEGFQHGMNPKHLKRIRDLEKENNTLKQLLAEKELENKLKGDLLKKKLALEKRKRL